MITEQGLQHTPEYDPKLHEREAIRAYILYLRKDHPSEMKKSRREYERTVNEILSNSKHNWRIVVDDSSENDHFHEKFGFYIGELDVISAGYSKHDVSTVITLGINTLDPDPGLEMPIPINHIPDEYRLLTEEEYLSEI